MFFRQITDPTLSQYAYLIGCQQTGEALIVDPQRDIDRYLDIASEEGLEIVAATETHIHADFISGVREFAERGVRAYLSGEGGVEWRYDWADSARYDCVTLSAGDRFNIGRIGFETLHTPGHTPEHIAFLVTDEGGGAKEPMGLLSGDFVFVGDLGRPDLLESAVAVEGAREPAARALLDSVQQFFALPEFLQVWPGHGAGSACGKALGAVPDTTVGYELRFSPAIAAARAGEEAFLGYILEGQPEPPLYFGRMKRVNKEGAPVLGALPCPREVDGKELGVLAGAADVIVVDTRSDRSAFMARHLPRSIYAPLTKSFNTAVGSVMEDEATQIMLIIEHDDLERAVRDLVRIGFDSIVAFAEPETLDRYFEEGGASSSIPEIDFADVAVLMTEGGVRVLDVRYASEYAAAHVPGAINASYTRLPEYTDRIPDDQPLLIHCLSGARAAVASSYLARQGRDVQYVNDLFANHPSDASASHLEI